MIETKANEAHKIFKALDDKMGFQVIIYRKIERNEISKIKNISQIVGWRHFPNSHEKKRCLCPACLAKGSFKYNNTQKKRLKELFKKLRNTDKIEEMKYILSEIRYDTDYNIKGKLEPKDEELIINIFEVDNDEIKPIIIGIMAKLFGKKYENYYFQWIYEGKNINIVEESLFALFEIYGYKILEKIELDKCTKETIELINIYKEE